jgi:hypothetical protein
MQIDPPKALNLHQLQQELAAAGVPVSALGTSGDPPGEVHTYGPAGEIVDLPANALAVVRAHKAGIDQSTLVRLGAVAVALNNPTAYLDPAIVPNPTQAQIDAATVQRNAWAAILSVQPLTIPVTQAATAADIRPL